MPIGLDEAQNHHPLELTREASPEAPMTEGDFTLEQLRDMFGKPEMPEEEVLAAAGDAGMAFFKVGDVYKSFAPLKGDAVELVVSPSEPSGVSVDGADGPFDEDGELEDDEDAPYPVNSDDDLSEDQIPGYADMLEDPDDDGDDDVIGDNTDDAIAVVSVSVADDDEEDDGTADPITF